ncbi:MAG: anaerobic ribonucleoside-triphosphate reductase activating protein [Candidatus Cloacimonetes bacterium]|nr:anaerobic ribonucleoside-triphosphate reductase activating protein [Candidatus Cloacimonadota bacterium]
MIDYPGKLCAVIFTRGCNLRCPFCHNPSLVLPEKYTELLSIEDLFAFLSTRIGKLDAVSITGGEPLLQDDIGEIIRKIKEMGFLVKIDTNGTHPEKLKVLIESSSPDYIAMDIKAYRDSFIKASGGFAGYDKMLESMEIVRASNSLYEFRTTIVKGIHSVKDIEKCIELIKPGESYFLQQFQSAETLNPDYRFAHGLDNEDIQFLQHKAMESGIKITIR